MALTLLLAVAEIVTVRADPAAHQMIVETRFDGLPAGVQPVLPRDPAADDRALGGFDYYFTYPNRREHARIRGTWQRLEITLPRRYGSFGCVDELCTMAGGFYPRVDGVVPRIEVVTSARAYVSGDLVVVGTRMHAERRGSWLFIGRGDGRRALEAAARLRPAGGTLVEVPLRRSLAERHGDTVLVSDRLFHVAPPLRIYHERALATALAAPPPAAEDVRDRLVPVSFVPAIDQMMYAQKVEFADDYFFAPERPRWRIVWSDVGALFTTSTLDLAFSLDLLVRPPGDLVHAVRAGVFHDDATEIGGFVGYRHGFGRPADPSRLSGALGLTLTGARLDERFADLGVPGASFATTLGASFDDRPWPVDPWRYEAAALDATWRVVSIPDAGTAHQGTLGARLEGARPIVPGLVLAAQARAAVTFGDLRFAAEMLEGGGPRGLRAFAQDELLGRTLLLGRAELRRTFTRSWDLDLAHVATVRGLGMALFYEAAAVGTCEPPIEQTLYHDAGLSFRSFFDWAGVLPSTLELDLAFALDRGPRSCFGTPTSPGDAEGHPRGVTAFLLRLGPSF